MTQDGGKRKPPSEWTTHLMKVYKEMKAKNPETKLGDAMKEAKKTYKSVAKPKKGGDREEEEEQEGGKKKKRSSKKKASKKKKTTKKKKSTSRK
jgi:hypothetical protein